jgi:predicted Holliday junction resolvase-like endonuclease
MKRKFIVLFALAVLIFASTACGILKLDTKEVKVIEKPALSNTSTQVKENADDQNINENINGNNNENNNKSGQNSNLNKKSQEPETDSEKYIKSIINDRATEVMQALKAYDLEKLSHSVHPAKGVRFTPYAYINKDIDLVFNANEIKNMASSSKKYTRGYSDGSGLPIELAFKDYYKKFVYDVNFVNAEKIGYNKILGKGNTINNILEVYNNAIFIEYHFSGFDPKYGGMDWRSLRLVFEKDNDTWYLVGIIHDQWTI